MKHVLLSVLLAASTPALAEPGAICIDASSNTHYNAQPLSPHAVLARNAFGKDQRAARLTTTCIHITRGSFVALHSLATCIGKGDDVAISSIDGRHEQCRVTGVAPVAQSYAGAKYGYD